MNQSNGRNISIIVAALIISGAWIYKGGSSTPAESIPPPAPPVTEAQLVDAGHILPVTLENELAEKLTAIGALDPNVLPQVTELNLLWAFGLANKNAVLEKGPIRDPRYGGPELMASIGGWTAARGPAMDHLGMHEMVTLEPNEQELVEKVAKKVFRPCCKNSAYFPDCNHGMATLGLLEILASQGADEQALLTAANKANAIWFPERSPGGGCGIDSAPATKPSCAV